MWRLYCLVRDDHCHHHPLNGLARLDERIGGWMEWPMNVLPFCIPFNPQLSISFQSTSFPFAFVRLNSPFKDFHFCVCQLKLNAEKLEWSGQNL